MIVHVTKIWRLYLWVHAFYVHGKLMFTDKNCLDSFLWNFGIKLEIIIVIVSSLGFPLLLFSNSQYFSSRSYSYAIYLSPIWVVGLVPTNIAIESLWTFALGHMFRRDRKCFFRPILKGRRRLILDRILINILCYRLEC